MFLASNAINCGCKGKRCSNRKYHGSASKRSSSLRVTTSIYSLQTQAIPTEQLPKWSSSTGIHLVGTDTTAPYSLAGTNAPPWKLLSDCQASGMNKEPLLFSASNSVKCGCKGQTLLNRKAHGPCKQTPVSLRVTTSTSRKRQAIPNGSNYQSGVFLPETPCLGTDTTTPYSYAWDQRLRLEAPPALQATDEKEPRTVPVSKASMWLQ